MVRTLTRSISRKRKSKCDGNIPSCAACEKVYSTPCVYSPESDHRRKGVYKNDLESLKTRNSTLQTLVTALLNLEEHDAFDLVREMRSCDSLDEVAERIANEDLRPTHEGEGANTANSTASHGLTLGKHLYGRMADLLIDEGSVRYIGGTSHLIHDGNDDTDDMDDDGQLATNSGRDQSFLLSWTTATSDPELIVHLLNMYFTVSELTGRTYHNRDIF